MSDAHMDAKVLRRAAEIVETPGCWIQGAIAIDAQGNKLTRGDAEGAVAWCAYGVIDKAQAEIGVRGAPTQWLWNTVGQIGSWNNAPGRTADEVAAALREAADRCDGVSPEPSLTATPA